MCSSDLGLVLAHHPQFRPEAGRSPMMRDASRVDRLFQLILASCRPSPGLDPLRSGAGVPDVVVAVGVIFWGGYLSLAVGVYRQPNSLTEPAPTEELTQTALTSLETAMRSAGLLPSGTNAI